MCVPLTGWVRVHVRDAYKTRKEYNLYYDSHLPACWTCDEHMPLGACCCGMELLMDYSRVRPCQAATEHAARHAAAECSMQCSCLQSSIDSSRRHSRTHLHLL